MRKLILAAPVLLAACGNIPGYPPKQAAMDACFWQTVKEASTGDWHDWTLPKPGSWTGAGQKLPDCWPK